MGPAAPGAAPWVVKIGGSLAGSPALRQWLAVLAGSGPGRAVVVPGGGEFADAVRRAHVRWRFSERAAHDMALHAMAQYALMLCAIEPRLVSAQDPAEIRRALDAGRAAVWTPVARALAGEPAIEASWEVTADSLAAWLAGGIGAVRLVLVKSRPPPPPGVGVSDIIRDALVDAAFARYAGMARCAICLLGPDDHLALARALATGGHCGTTLAPVESGATGGASDASLACNPPEESGHG